MSESFDDGGAAFPYVEIDSRHGTRVECGMSLRDWFAGQSLAGLTSLGKNLHDKSVSCEATLADVVASQSYAIADAMLKARAKALKYG